MAKNQNTLAKSKERNSIDIGEKSRSEKNRCALTSDHTDYETLVCVDARGRTKTEKERREIKPES